MSWIGSNRIWEIVRIKQKSNFMFITFGNFHCTLDESKQKNWITKLKMIVFIYLYIMIDKNLLWH